MTRIDLFWRGLVRGFSRSMTYCHSCFLAYENIYKTVSVAEEIYVEWNLETTSAFLIFSKITDCYNYMKEVQRLCQYKEFWVAFKTRLLSPDIWAPNAWPRVVSDLMTSLKWMFILWYSLWWGTMEDTGIAVGYFTSLVLNLHIDDVVGNQATD